MVESAALIKKLRIKPRLRLWLVNVPKQIAEAITAGAEIELVGGHEPMDGVIAFAETRAEVDSFAQQILAVLPKDGLTSGERLLNSKPALQPGDCFLAEVVGPRQPYPVLVGGTVAGITPPGRYGRPGYVSIRMTQLVQSAEGGAGAIPWRNG